MSRRPDQEEEMSDTQTEQIGIRDRAREYISSTKHPLLGSNCKVFIVGTEDIPVIWENLLPIIELSQDDDRELSPDDFFEALMNEEMHLWIALDGKELLACMISQFATYPQKRVLRIIFIGGEERDKWLGSLWMVEDFALTNGCTHLEVWGRKAWLKILKDWKCKYHILTKDLTARMH